MLVSSPAFPLSVTDKSLHELVKAFAISRRGTLRSISDKKLSCLPYWFIDYSIIQKNEGNGKTIKGSIAMDASKNEFEPKVEHLIKNIPKDISNEIPDSIPAIVIKPKSSRNDARKAAIFELVSLHNTPKENIAITSFELYFIPFWNVTATVDEAQYNFVINANTKEFADDGGLVVKEKNFQEIVHETIDELKTPEGWQSNSRNTINSMLSFFTGSSKNIGLQKISAIDAAIVLLLIILLLVLVRII